MLASDCKFAAKVGKPMTMDAGAAAADTNNIDKLGTCEPNTGAFAALVQTFTFYAQNCVRPKRA
jgi:hypothetical protein